MGERDRLNAHARVRAHDARDRLESVVDEGEGYLLAHVGRFDEGRRLYSSRLVLYAGGEAREAEVDGRGDVCVEGVRVDLRLFSSGALAR